MVEPLIRTGTFVVAHNGVLLAALLPHQLADGRMIPVVGAWAVFRTTALSVARQDSRCVFAGVARACDRHG